MDLEATEKSYREKVHAACATYLSSEIRPFIDDCLINHKNDVFIVEQRVKQVDSFCDKIRRKNYADPINEIADLIGVRIITYFDDDIDVVIEALRKSILVDEEQSYDNADELDLEAFGYRSVHIVGSIPKSEHRSDIEVFNKSGKFEIQIRSILQHAWANMSHQADYKKGTALPKDQRRRLFRLAALLESADEQFSLIRQNVYKYRDGYSDVTDDELLDSDLNFYSVEVYLSKFQNMEYWEGLAEGIGFAKKPPKSSDSRYHGNPLYSSNCVYRVLITAQMLGGKKVIDLHSIIQKMESKNNEALRKFFKVTTERNISFKAVGPDILVVAMSICNADDVVNGYDWGGTFYETVKEALLEACQKTRQDE